MRMSFPSRTRLAAALGLWFSASIAHGQDPPKPPAPNTTVPGPGATPAKLPPLFPQGYLGHEALGQALRALGESHPARLSVGSLGKSLEGRDIPLVTIGKPGRFQPAILIAANLEADHLIGSQVALRMVERLAAAQGATAAWLDGLTIYVVPRLNPDGAEHALGRTEGRPLMEFRGDLRPIDRDRDGKAGEDSPDDLNGDDLVTRVRHQNPGHGPLTLVPDAKDPRILRKADAAKGERGLFAEEDEGRDDDGDGRRNEDPRSGVNLARNWPHRWTEFDPETGFSPASEPEVHALIRFLFDHPEIIAVWSFGLHDNLREEPKKPQSTLDDADLPLFAELTRVYLKAITPTDAAPPKGSSPAGKGAPAPGGTSDGSLGEWAYHQFGVVGLSSRLWTTPAIPATATAATVEKPKPAEEAKGKDAAPAKEAAKPETPAIPEDGEARWLYWNDHLMGGRAFLPFKPFDHPDLGPVEIGGWRPGVRINPPATEVDALAEVQLAFLADLAAKRPKLSVPPVKIEAKGGGLFAIAVVVENPGYLPTALAQGTRTTKAPPLLIRLDPGGAKMVAGRPLERVESLAGSGGRKEFRWLLLAPEAGAEARLDVSCPKAGRIERPLPLR